jgi:uncharacterized protein
VIDRVGPALRPPGRPAMRMIWADLGFLHWTVPVAVLRPLVPEALEIDTFDGLAFVGLVPFTMRGVRPRSFPALPWLSSFHEVNVRTYVHHLGRDPGVWFLSLDAANPIAVVVARTIWKLPYHFARMALERDGPAISYASYRRWPRPASGGRRSPRSSTMRAAWRWRCSRFSPPPATDGERSRIAARPRWRSGVTSAQLNDELTLAAEGA